MAIALAANVFYSEAELIRELRLSRRWLRTSVGLLPGRGRLYLGSSILRAFVPCGAEVGTGEAASRRRSLVYVVLCEDAGRVKIGVTGNIRNRMYGIRNGCPFPVRLIGMMPGGHAVERELHDRFADLRINLEWFTASPLMMAYLAERITIAGDEPCAGQL